MKRVKNIIIGFGKAGKTLAMEFEQQKESTLLIEKDPKMYGGSCINIACIPSKTLANFAQKKPKDSDDKKYYKEAIQKKKDLINQLNQDNYENVANLAYVELINGEASFEGENAIRVASHNGNEETYFGERIFINTGSIPNLPRIENLRIDGKTVHTSRTIMDDEELPEKLVIIGDGNVGLEFASMYAQFGSTVTILADKEEDELFPQLDEDVAKEVLKALKDKGIIFIYNAQAYKIESISNNQVKVAYHIEEEKLDLDTNKILIATGQRPNIEQLNLEEADVLLAEDGFIQINKRLQTNKNHIYALGDVNGGPQQTYLSMDDYRVVKSHLFGDGSYDLSNRDFVPTTLFIDPPLSTVGLTEKVAKDGGYSVKVATLPVKSIPKAKIRAKTTGLYKAIIDVDSKRVLGVALFGEGSEEVINVIATAMRGKLTYKDLANHIFTHPTMSEALNDLFSSIDV